jgi:hypothetical protein
VEALIDAGQSQCAEPYGKAVDEVTAESIRQLTADRAPPPAGLFDGMAADLREKAMKGVMLGARGYAARALGE